MPKNNHDSANIVASLEESPNILVVCTGNICRSPMGEIVLQSKIDEAGLDINVTSGAVSREEQGKGVYPPAKRVLQANGYATATKQRAHRVTEHELHEAGLILAMTTGHARALRRLCESAGVPLEKIHLWREFTVGGPGIAPGGVFGEGGVLASVDHDQSSRHTSDFYYSSGRWDVIDPWGGSDKDFEDTFHVVLDGSNGVVNMLRENQ